MSLIKKIIALKDRSLKTSVSRVSILTLVLYNYVVVELQCQVPSIERASLSASGFVDFQDSVTVACESGYEIQGSDVLYCHDNQTFGTLPTCQSKLYLKFL